MGSSRVCRVVLTRGAGALFLELAKSLLTSKSPGVSRASLAAMLSSLTPQAPSVARAVPLPVFPCQAPTAPASSLADRLSDFWSSLGCCPAALCWGVLRAVLSGSCRPRGYVLATPVSPQFPGPWGGRSLPGSKGCQDSPGVPHRSPEPSPCLATNLHCVSLEAEPLALGPFSAGASGATPSFSGAHPNPIRRLRCFQLPLFPLSG